MAKKKTKDTWHCNFIAGVLSTPVLEHQQATSTVFIVSTPLVNQQRERRGAVYTLSTMLTLFEATMTLKGQCHEMLNPCW